MVTEQQIKEKLEAKQAQIASIVGEKEAARLMEKALHMVMDGTKSLSDIIDLKN